METVGIILEIIAVVGFLFFVWPHIRNEDWKKKFVHNKHALSILIVFILIFMLIYGIIFIFDTFFPVERLDK